MPARSKGRALFASLENYCTLPEGEFPRRGDGKLAAILARSVRHLSVAAAPRPRLAGYSMAAASTPVVAT
jgi:hypothetical protein